MKWIKMAQVNVANIGVVLLANKAQNYLTQQGNTPATNEPPITASILLGRPFEVCVTLVSFYNRDAGLASVEEYPWCSEHYEEQALFF